LNEIARRQKRLQSAISSARLDAVVICGNTEFQQKGYIRYYAGWRLHGGSAFMVVAPGRAATLLLGLGAQAEWAKELSAVPDTRAVLDKIDGVADALLDIVPRVSRVGVVGLNTILTNGDAQRLTARLPGVELEDATDMVEALWCILSDEDVLAVESAHTRVSDIFDAFCAALRPERTELDVVADTYSAAVRLGCLEGMVHLNCDEKSGTRPATGRIVRSSDIYKLFMEFLTPEGYMIELGACLSFRAPAPAWLGKHELVAEAISDAIENSRPGMVGDDLVQRIRRTYEKSGVEISGRRLWDFHGQGMHSLLRPFGLPGSRDPISANMMINIHPGLLTTDGLGISMTNNYIVTPGGGRALGGFQHRWHILG
jgi:Xaa-Pro dipeptidase